MCIRTLADSTGPKGEKICNNAAELVVPGILPIQRALVGNELCSLPFSCDKLTSPAFAGLATDPGGPPLVNTNPTGAGATVLTIGPVGAESIFPKPMRTGAVSDKAATRPPMRLSTSSRARTASFLSVKLTNAQVWSSHEPESRENKNTHLLRQHAHTLNSSIWGEHIPKGVARSIDVEITDPQAPSGHLRSG